ncbi:MAG: class I SAM-dependent methyltransferase [Dehalococcoidia bacterium]
MIDAHRVGEIGRTAAILTRNLILGGNLSALRLARRPGMLASYVSENLFLFRTLADQRPLPQRPVLASFDAPTAVDVRLANQPSGAWFHEVASYAIDIVSLCLLARILEPKVVFEIGTLRGYTALHFALNTPDDADVYTLDLPRDHQGPVQLATTILDAQHIGSSVRMRSYDFDEYPEAAKIHCLFGDSATFDYSPFHKRVGLFFIDGAHSYEYVRSDTLNALRCCHPGSVIAWHDFGRVGVNGVSRWLAQLARKYDVVATPGGSLAYLIIK